MKKIFKNKKNKIIALSLGSSLLASAGLGIFLFSYNNKNSLGVNYRNYGSNNPEIFNNGVADTKNATISHTDRNLIEAKSPVVIEKNENKIDPVEVIKPQPTPTPIPLPPQPTPKPIEQPKERKRTIVEIHGVKVVVEAEVAPGRILNEQDIRDGITNKDPYIAQIVGKITNVEVTEELKKAVANNLLENRYNGLKTYADKFFNSLPLEDNDNFKFQDFIKQNSSSWTKMIDRFKKLLDSENVVNFLKEPAASEFRAKKQFESQDHKYAWLIRNLDYSKFTTLSGNAQKHLKDGYTATVDNVYINENGELDSYTYDPAPGYNTVTSRLERDNRERRVFSYNSPYGRTPADISNGEYPGWTKKEVTTSDQFKEFNVGKDDDIKIFELTKKEKDKDGNEIKGFAVEIDANNSQGYDKTKKLIEDLQNKGIKITSYRIKNMGDKDPQQKFKEIIRALPKDLPHLELFLSSKATNTASLIELENKDIKELSLFTEGNPLLDNWSINPWAIKGVRWVNTIDYNVNWERNGKTISRIMFNTLAFEESDIKKDQSDLAKKYERINLGLRMAYYVRNNEGVFQGNFGPGLNPDNNEGNNSYPTRLDFSLAPSIKSLKGLIFSDIRNGNNKPRKLKYLKFYNDKEYFELTTDDLDQGQLDTVMAINEPRPPKTEIKFSNENQTKAIKFKDSKELTASAISNLNVLFNLSEIPRNVIVPKNAVKLRAQLQQNGFSVTESDGIDNISFN